MDTKPLLNGVIPPMITPFTDDGEIFEEGIRAVANFIVEGGAHGLFICGSYGSFALMTDDERKRVAEIIVDEVGGRVPIVVHVGTPGTSRSLYLARHAEEIGATALASVVPFYYSSFAYSEKHIISFYSALIKSVEIPVYLYNNPKTTGFNVKPPLLKKLMEIGIEGWKDSSGDIQSFIEAINEISPLKPNFGFITGTAGLMMATYVIGAQAFVAGTGNIFPKLTVELYDALVESDLVKAKELQYLISDIRKYQALENSRPAACHTILKMIGVPAGTVREPWTEMVDQNQKYLREKLSELGLL